MQKWKSSQETNKVLLWYSGFFWDWNCFASGAVLRKALCDFHQRTSYHVFLLEERVQERVQILAHTPQRQESALHRARGHFGQQSKSSDFSASCVVSLLTFHFPKVRPPMYDLLRLQGCHGARRVRRRLSVGLPGFLQSRALAPPRLLSIIWQMKCSA